MLGSAFYEPSTRTRMSHESAMLRLGGRATGFADPSTTRAGGFYQETLGDMAVMLSHLGDLIVFRHPETGSGHLFAWQAVSRSSMPGAGTASAPPRHWQSSTQRESVWVRWTARPGCSADSCDPGW
ncbi:hypothetical protein [Streptomyces sp. BA2]|uniref:hypothetical protein n=1 Tax=Streptomyces sp. BA2 TaxID=436595 RepID=UPI003FA6D857